MRSRITTLILLACVATTAFAFRTETLQELLERAKSARIEDQAPLYLEAASRQLKNADELYTAGKGEDARKAVEDVVIYSEKAHDAAIQSGKKLKNTEISLRKMAEKLRDIKRSLNFEDQAPVQAAADRLESFRTDLLARMFKGK